MSIIATINLCCFLTLPKVLIGFKRMVSTKEPLINYNKNIMMTNENYMVAFQQKIMRKEATTQKWDV
jgi:hypothetical protein